jgi:hypothetical protein
MENNFTLNKEGAVYHLKRNGLYLTCPFDGSISNKKTCSTECALFNFVKLDDRDVVVKRGCSFAFQASPEIRATVTE